MSVMLDLPGDIMDLNTLTKCLLEKAVDMAGAGGGRILLQSGDSFILSAQQLPPASERGGRGGGGGGQRAGDKERGGGQEQKLTNFGRHSGNASGYRRKPGEPSPMGIRRR